MKNNKLLNKKENEDDDNIVDYDKKDKELYDKYENDEEKVEQEQLEEDDDDNDEEEEDEDENTDPKILITTTELKISFKTYKLCRELTRVLPNAHYFYRKNVRISKVIPEAVKRNYSALILINEDHKKPSNLYDFNQYVIQINFISYKLIK